MEEEAKIKIIRKIRKIIFFLQNLTAAFSLILTIIYLQNYELYLELVILTGFSGAIIVLEFFGFEFYYRKFAKNTLKCYGAYDDFAAYLRNPFYRDLYGDVEGNAAVDSFFHIILYIIYVFAIIVNILLSWVFLAICQVLGILMKFHIFKLHPYKQYNWKKKIIYFAYGIQILQTLILNSFLIYQQDYNKAYENIVYQHIFYAFMILDYVNLLLIIGYFILKKVQRKKEQKILLANMQDLEYAPVQQKEKEKEQFSEALLQSKLCIKCEKRKRKCAFLPCGCYYYCNKCLQKAIKNKDKCYKCNEDVLEGIKIFTA